MDTDKLMGMLQTMMDNIQAKADENQAKADKTLKETLAKMEFDRKTDKEEMKADRNAYREDVKEVMAIIKSWSGDLKADCENGEETVACQEKAEARLEVEEPASEEIKFEVAENKEVPVEDAEVRSVAEPRKNIGTNDESWPRCAARRDKPRPGREASREATGFGRCPQRDDPACSGCATQNVTDNGHYPGVLWIPEGIGRCPQRDDPLCRKATAQGELRREKPGQG
jgi:hypothetical protein